MVTDILKIVVTSYTDRARFEQTVVKAHRKDNLDQFIGERSEDRLPQDGNEFQGITVDDLSLPQEVEEFRCLLRNSGVIEGFRRVFDETWPEFAARVGRDEDTGHPVLTIFPPLLLPPS